MIAAAKIFFNLKMFKCRFEFLLKRDHNGGIEISFQGSSPFLSGLHQDGFVRVPAMFQEPNPLSRTCASDDKNHKGIQDRGRKGQKCWGAAS